MRLFLLASCVATSMLIFSGCSDDDRPAANPGSPTPTADASVTPEAATGSFPEASARDLKKTLDDVVAASVAPGVSLAVDHPTHGKWTGSSGTADMQSHEALAPEHRFRAGSILKVAVATAMLQLVERGERSLDDKLTAVLPQTITARVANADAITIRMLLNHSSGIPEFTTDAFDAELMKTPGRVWTLDEHLDRAAAQPPVFAPGTGWSYSNTNYLLLGEILGTTTGQPWRRVLAERVFARAGLEDTTLPTDGEHSCTRCSRGYEVVDGKPIDVTEVDPSMAGAAGGSSLVTTTKDLAKLVRAIAGGKLFDKPETLQTMLAFVEAPIPQEAQTGYGLGVARFRTGDIELVGHLGGTAGFQSFMFIHPSSGIVASGYMNRRGDFGAFIMPVLDALARLP